MVCLKLNSLKVEDGAVCKIGAVGETKVTIIDDDYEKGGTPSVQPVSGDITGGGDGAATPLFELPIEFPPSYSYDDSAGGDRFTLRRGTTAAEEGLEGLLAAGGGPAAEEGGGVGGGGGGSSASLDEDSERSALSLEPYDKSQLIQLCEEGGLGPEVPDDWSLELNKQRMQAEEAVQRDTHSPRTRGRIRSARRTGRLGGYAYSQSSSPPRGRLSYAYEGSPATSEGVIDLVEGVGDILLPARKSELQEAA